MSEDTQRTRLDIRRRDTPENRAFWDSVERAKEDWERLQPEWYREWKAAQVPSDSVSTVSERKVKS